MSPDGPSERPRYRLLGADGRPTRVVAATPMLVDRPCYEVAFSDGTRVVADSEHQWVTETRAAVRTWSRDSTVHGPAISEKCSPPMRRCFRTRSPARAPSAVCCR